MSVLDHEYDVRATKTTSISSVLFVLFISGYGKLVMNIQVRLVFSLGKTFK